MTAALAYGLRTVLGFQPTSFSEIAFRLGARREKEALAENDTLRSAKTHSTVVSLFSGGKYSGRRDLGSTGVKNEPREAASYNALVYFLVCIAPDDEDGPLKLNSSPAGRHMSF